MRKWNFIPNYDFDIIQNLLAIDVEPINILYSRSDYASDKKWTSKIKDDEYKYPVAYSVNRKNEIKLIYSNINNKGHYKISKLIFGSGATGFYIDDEGNYSLSEFCTGIIDKKENLQKIKKAIETSKFISIIKAISVSKAEINRKILKYFKKDFYTLFCDDIKNILDNKVDEIISASIIVKGKKSKSKNNEEVNIIENYDEILTVSKKKTSKSKINIIRDDVILEEEPEIKVKKIIKKKVKTNTDIEL